MRVPISWLRDFFESDADAAAIARVLTSRGFNVEAIEEQPTPQHIVVGRIETLERHPLADRLLVGKVDVGGRTLQIVTGATNVAVGNKVPIALAGAAVYSRETPSDGKRAAKVIQKSVLRGVESDGMMCSPEELALPGEFEDGILILEDEAPVGESFWRAARFGGAVLNVEVPSNRADCSSMAGLAREVAAGLGVPYREPKLEEHVGTRPPPIGVRIGDPGLCRRLLGQYFWNVRNRRSPMWMTLRLQAAGVRSLDLLVDISNYVQLETGQPLHFYDAKRLRGDVIVARGARAGEKVVTLDGVERTLEEGTPVIADGSGPVGIAGIMGGAESGVTRQTTELYLESPNFAGKRIRRASFRLGLRTEGSARHERDLPLELPEIGRRLAARLLVEAGAQPSAVATAGEEPGPARWVEVRLARLNAVLGSQCGAKQIRAALDPMGFTTVEKEPDCAFSVGVPFWRPDVSEEVDLIEEVARASGYDEIPERRAVAAPQAVDESLFRQETLLAGALAALGYNEIITISLAGSRMVSAWERSGIPFWKSVVTIANPLSDDQRFLRPSLLPGVLATAQRAWLRAEGPLRLFEIGHIFRSPGSEPAQAEPHEHSKPGAEQGVYDQNGALEWPSLCGLVCFAAGETDAALDRRLLEVKGEVEFVVAKLAGSAGEAVPEERPYFHPGASGDIRLGSATVAKFGRLHPRLARAYELPPSSYAFMLYLEHLPRERPVPSYAPLPKFPGTRRDIAVVVDEAVAASSLIAAIRQAAVPDLEGVTAFDEYRGPQVAAGKKSIALALRLRKPDATITDAQADAAQRVALAALAKRFGASLRT